MIAPSNAQIAARATGVSRARMMRSAQILQIPESLFADLMLDPVMAATVILKVKLDHYQKARLRAYWWFPELIDSSGVSTGKTLVNFVYINLRCILIPDHDAAIYFPNFQTGKLEFWPYFAKTMEKSEIFRQQFKVHHRKVGEHLDPGAWWMEYKNGSRMVMPAPNFINDSETQASRRFNTLIVDDWLRAEDMGDGISKQLVDRTTKASFNKNHPVLCNHIKFTGHAEKPSHKGYIVVKGFRRLIADGSRDHALISFCYRDMSEEFAQTYRPDKRIKTARKIYTKDQFQRQWLGLWSRDGTTYYPEVTLLAGCRAYCIPRIEREYEHEINIAGFDVAPGQKHKADYSCLFNWRVVEILRGVSLPETFIDEEANRAYNIAATFAQTMSNKSAPETAGYLHMMNRIFAWKLLVLDPGGGGLWVYPELKKNEQLVNGVRTKTVGLVTREDYNHGHADKIPSVCYFRRKSDLGDIIEPQYLVSDDGFIAGLHLKYREAWEAGHFHYPMPMPERPDETLRLWTPDQMDAQKTLDTGLVQLGNVQQMTDGEGRVVISKNHGFPLFRAVGRKDIAYAGFYGYCGVLSHFLQPEQTQDDVDVAMMAW